MGKILYSRMAAKSIPELGKLYSDIIDSKYIAYGEINCGISNDGKSISNEARNIIVKELRGILKNSKKIVYIAHTKKQLIGFISLQIKKGYKKHNECWIQDLGVSPEFRKQGVAKKLLKMAYIWAHRNNSSQVFLESGINNLHAHKLFEKEGFRPLSTIFIKNKNTSNFRFPL